MANLKFEKYWVNVEIYGHSFNVEIGMTSKGYIAARYDCSRHWMPSFGSWSVVNVQGLRPYVMEVGVRKKNGKRTNFFTFDVREREHCKAIAPKKRELHETVNGIAAVIFGTARR